jgi:hypothetical protein
MYGVSQDRDLGTLRTTSEIGARPWIQSCTKALRDRLFIEILHSDQVCKTRCRSIGPVSAC